MPKIDAIVGNAALRISGAAKKIGDAQIGERMSRAPGKLKQWGRDHIKLGQAKVNWTVIGNGSKVDFREDLEEEIPRQKLVPDQPASRGPEAMMREAKIVLLTIAGGHLKSYIASLTSFGEHAEEAGASAAATAFVQAFKGLNEEEQASIRAKIIAVDKAAIDRVIEKGLDPAVLRWSEALLKLFGPLPRLIESQPDEMQQLDLAGINGEVAKTLLPSAVAARLLASMKNGDETAYKTGLHMLRSVDTDETIDTLSSSFLQQSDSSRQEILKGIEGLHGAIVKQTNVARLDKESSAILLRILNIQEEIGLPAFSAMAEESQARPASPIVEQPPQPAGRQKTTRAWRRAHGPKNLRPVFLKPAENLPKSTATVSVQKGVDFLRIMDGTLVGGFVKTLHDLARATPEELTAFVTSLETALKYGPPQRASIERLNNLMDKVLKELAKDEAFIEDRGERVEKTWEIWMLLKTRIPSLVSRPKNSVADDDMKAAKAAFTEIYQA